MVGSTGTMVHPVGSFNVLVGLCSSQQDAMLAPKPTSCCALCVLIQPSWNPDSTLWPNSGPLFWNVAEPRLFEAHAWLPDKVLRSNPSHIVPALVMSVGSHTPLLYAPTCTRALVLASSIDPVPWE